jgi:hypothetical protein
VTASFPRTAPATGALSTLPLCTFGFGYEQGFFGFRVDLRGLADEIVRQLANALPSRVRSQAHLFTLTLYENLGSIGDWDGTLVFLLAW